MFPAAAAASLVVVLSFGWPGLDPDRDPVLSPRPPAALLLGSGLQRFDERGRPAGELAGHVSRRQGGKIWEFRLREDLRLADGALLDARTFCRLWRRQVPRHAAAHWLLRELAAAPAPVDARTVRFVLSSPRPEFPRRLAHPWLFLQDESEGGGPSSLGPYRMEEPEANPSRPRLVLRANREVRADRPPAGDVVLVRPPPAGGLILLEMNEAAAVRLAEDEVPSGWTGEGVVLCAAGATTYRLTLNPAVLPSSDRRRRLAALLDPGKLARRVAPQTGTPVPAPPVDGPPTGPREQRPPGPAVTVPETPGDEDAPAPSTSSDRPEEMPVPLLVDGDDHLALEMADQIQADFLEAGIHVLVTAVPGPLFERRLRSGRFTAALVAARSPFAEPALDLLALLSATGLAGAIPFPRMETALALPAGRRRGRLAGEVLESLARDGILLPLIRVDECWAWRDRPPARDHFQWLTMSPASRFAPLREGSPL